MRRIASIALHSFKESVREKVLYNLVGFALLLMAAAILFGQISVGIEKIMLVNLGLSAISIFGLVIAIFIGVGLVSKEIERRTVYNILSKPVRRFEFVLGKYAGLLLTLGINTAAMTLGFYAALYEVTRQFIPGDLAFLWSIYLILLELAIVVGIAILFSCLSSPLVATMFTFGLFVIGSYLPALRGFSGGSHPGMLHAVTAVLYYILPNFTNFQAISGVADGIPVPHYQLIFDSYYALLYVAVLLSASILLFERREFK